MIYTDTLAAIDRSLDMLSGRQESSAAERCCSCDCFDPNGIRDLEG